MPFKTLDPEHVFAVARKSGVWLLIVGGAASLKTEAGDVLIDTPGFPDFIKVEAEPARQFLNTLKAGVDFEWTFLSPAMFFGPGERTGSFRLGDETLLTAADGKSSISYEDFAIAMIDEIESPKHKNARFTVGY
jgi:putative NADH-flavin reductase